MRRTAISVILSLALAFGAVSPASAYDDDGPILSSFSVSPSVADVTSQSVNILFRISARDVSGITDLGVNCGNSRGYPMGQIIVSPDSYQGPYVYADSVGDFFPSLFEGDRFNFSMEFQVPMRAGTFPGPVTCYVGGSDLLGNYRDYGLVGQFLVIRDGIGSPTPTPSPTPVTTPSPATSPRPVPSPSATTNVSSDLNEQSGVFSSLGLQRSSANPAILSAATKKQIRRLLRDVDPSVKVAILSTVRPGTNLKASRALAKKRASDVRKYIIKTGKVPSSRIFVSTKLKNRSEEGVQITLWR